MKLEIILIFSIIFKYCSCDESVLCPEDFCNKVKCKALPPKCQIQNATHNGILLPSPQTCNCCEFCLENINEGESCSVGNPSNPAPTTICGPGLYCKLRPGSEFDGTCSRMNTTCTRVQDDYDTRRQEGRSGSMEIRQTCDTEGLFSSYKCIPGQSCYCVDEDGKRIFGEADFTSIPEVQLQCKCSRDYNEAAKIVGKELNPKEHFRCASNGDYDTLQCFNNQCLCVDPHDGTPSNPNADLVNITLISKDTLPCYKKKENAKYFKKCEKKYLEVLEEVENYEKNGFSLVLSFIFPKCDLDGTYQAVQENSTHKFCVDKEGNVLNTVDIKTQPDLANAMDCKCSRALSVITTDEKPECAINGNYATIQCRRGTCRCVDSNGNQLCKTDKCEVLESSKKTLDCSDE